MNLKIPTYFTAIDNFSAPISKMEKRLESLSKTAMDVSRKSFLMGAAIALPLTLAAKSAIEFEDKMADVAKVANVTLGTKAFDELGDSAKRLGIFLGVGAKSAAGLMANLAQGGVSIDELDRVSEIAGKVGVAFGISADFAGEAFIKTKNALGGTIESTEKLMDTINYLGNTTAASSANLITFMSSGGSAAAAAAGATGEAVSGMGAQLISMGKSAEESATIMERFVKTTLMTAGVRKVFDAAGGGSEGMMAVIRKGAMLTGKAQDKYFSQFGQYGLSKQKMAKNFGALEKTVANATNTTLTADSVNQEFANRTATTAFKFQKASAQLEVMAINIGSVLLPAINKLLAKITPVIERVIAWTEANPELTKTILKITIVAAALVFAISATAFAIGIATKAMLIYSKATKALTAVQLFLNTAMIANPLGAFIMLVSIAIGLILLSVKYWDSWGAAITAVFAILGIFFAPIIAGFAIIVSIIQSFRRNWDMITTAFKEGGILAGIIAIGKTLLDVILYPLQQILEIVAKVTGFDWAANAAKGLEKFRGDIGLNVDGDSQPATSAVNPKEQQAAMFEKTVNNNKNEKLTVDFKNMPSGVTASRGEDSNSVVPVTGSTFAFGQ